MKLSDNLEELKLFIHQLLSKIEVLEGRVLFLEEENKSLREENLILKQENLILKQENLTLRQESAALRVQLGQNSKNSHNPPSTDKFTKKTPALPVEKGKKLGGQLSHKGDTLGMVSAPNIIVLHAPKSCDCCGRVILAEECNIVSKRQVFDIPEPRLEVTEHQLLGVNCCGCFQKGQYPSGVSAQVQYGNKILSLSSLLSTDFRIPFKKISNLFSTLYGYKFNEATAVSANKQLFDALLPVETAIKAQILASEVVHFDETGLKAASTTKWVHTASTDEFCYLFLHDKRGSKALRDEDSILKDYRNWAVHDCYSTYFTFKDCKHSICNAHILRELQALKEQNIVWASEMHNFLMELYTKTAKGKTYIEVPTEQVIWREKYTQICKKAKEEEDATQIQLGEKNARGKLKKTKGQALLYRLVKHQASVLAFAFVEKVPFTNNLAEQAIRNVKIKQKVATFRTEKGAKVYARIQGFINTIKKKSKSVFQEILNVLNGNINAWKTT
jgi:transposase